MHPDKETQVVTRHSLDELIRNQVEKKSNDSDGGWIWVDNQKTFRLLKTLTCENKQQTCVVEDTKGNLLSEDDTAGRSMTDHIILQNSQDTN